MAIVRRWGAQFDDRFALPVPWQRPDDAVAWRGLGSTTDAAPDPIDCLCSGPDQPMISS
jgi:hypothetical protein